MCLCSTLQSSEEGHGQLRFCYYVTILLHSLTIISLLDYYHILTKKTFRMFRRVITNKHSYANQFESAWFLLLFMSVPWPFPSSLLKSLPAGASRTNDLSPTDLLRRPGLCLEKKKKNEVRQKLSR